MFSAEKTKLLKPVFVEFIGVGQTHFLFPRVLSGDLPIAR
jgi:hypothetical protein